VNVDGSVYGGAPSGQVLASISNLATGNHTVTLTIKSSSPGGALYFEGATVTVGTGLTGANVMRTVVQDYDPSLTYSPAASWGSQMFDSWNMPHTPLNSTWHQIGYGPSGSVTVPFSGSAILAYGVGWSFFPTSYRASLDDHSPTLFASNSTLPNTTTGRTYTAGLLFFQANLSSKPHSLVLDNDNGGGYLGLDYIEIINVTGGSPFLASSNSSVISTTSLTSTQISSSSPIPALSPQSATHHPVPFSLIVGPILGATAIFIILIGILLYRMRFSRKRKDLEVNPFVIRPPVPEIITRDQATTVFEVNSPVSDNMTLVQLPSLKGPDRRSGPVSMNLPNLRTEDIVQAGGSDPGSPDIQAIRRDLQQLLQIVKRTNGHDCPPPPQYE